MTKSTNIKHKNPAGRKAELEGGKPRCIYLDDASWENAVKIGNGNGSYGIRNSISLALKLMLDDN